LRKNGRSLRSSSFGGRLDLLQIFRSERLLAEEVVIETFLGVRADGDLGAGEEPLHHARDHVRRVVADEVEAFLSGW